MTMENIDFIYDNQELGVAVLVMTEEVESGIKTQYKTCIRVNGITYSCGWITNSELYHNRIEAIIHTINRLYQRFLDKDIVFHKDTITTLSEAMNEAKKLRFQQLDLFDDGSTRKTYRISKNIPQPRRQQNKSLLSIYD